MGLTFLQPAFLLGVLAAAVPVLIHLINRQRALVQRFPAVRFLLLADKRTARKFRVRQWLLLALRVLAIVLLTTTLARPRLRGEAAGAVLTTTPQATVILIDNSVSMEYRDTQETRLQRARQLATLLVQQLPSQDRALIVPLVAPPQSTPEVWSFSQEQATLQEQVRAITLQYGRVELQNTLQRILTVLQESQVSRRRLIILSDLAANDWEAFHIAQLPLIPEQLTVHFLRLGSSGRDANVALTGVQITEKPFIEHAPLEVAVRLRNYSDIVQRNIHVDLLLGGEVVGQQLVSLGPDEEVTVPFRLVAPKAGLHWGEVRLQTDHFAVDDQFYYAIRTVPPVRVLVVDGDPGPSLFESETFYLTSALQPRSVLGASIFHPKPISWESLEQERLREYHVIILCNVETLPPQLYHRLYQFVQEGGGLILFTGHRVDPLRYNSTLFQGDTSLLPAPLGQPVQHPQEHPMSLGRIDTTHEILSVFTSDVDFLQKVAWYRYFAIEGGGVSSQVKTPLVFDDGQPLLLEKELGRGRVLLFTSTADRDWTNLPAHPVYVPLVHGLVGYAGHLAIADQRPATFFPEPIRLAGQRDDGGAAITVETPDGQTYPLRFTKDPSPSEVVVETFTVPGIYRLNMPQREDFLAVNVTRNESNFTKIQQGELRARWLPVPLVIEEEENLGQLTASAALPMQDLAGMFVLVLAAVLVAESICANRF